MYGAIYSGFVDFIRRNEGFEGGGPGEAGVIVLAVFLLVLLVIVQLFVVQWLWNTVLVRVTTIVKPLPSLLYAFGLLVLIALIHPGSPTIASA
jgi:hypothetical protein